MELETAIEVLGVSRTADRKDVRRAYLRLVKLHKPEQDPEGFRRIREAYECLVEGSARVFELSRPSPTARAPSHEARSPHQPAAPSTEPPTEGESSTQTSEAGDSRRSSHSGSPPVRNHQTAEPRPSARPVCSQARRLLERATDEPLEQVISETVAQLETSEEAWLLYFRVAGELPRIQLAALLRACKQKFQDMQYAVAERVPHHATVEELKAAARALAVDPMVAVERLIDKETPRAAASFVQDGVEYDALWSDADVVWETLFRLEIAGELTASRKLHDAWQRQADRLRQLHDPAGLQRQLAGEYFFVSSRLTSEQRRILAESLFEQDWDNAADLLRRTRTDDGIHSGELRLAIERQLRGSAPALHHILFQRQEPPSASPGGCSFGALVAFMVVLLLTSRALRSGSGYEPDLDELREIARRNATNSQQSDLVQSTAGLVAAAGAGGALNERQHEPTLSETELGTIELPEPVSQSGDVLRLHERLSKALLQQDCAASWRHLQTLDYHLAIAEDDHELHRGLAVARSALNESCPPR